MLHRDGDALPWICLALRGHRGRRRLRRAIRNGTAAIRGTVRGVAVEDGAAQGVEEAQGLAGVQLGLAALGEPATSCGRCTRGGRQGCNLSWRSTESMVNSVGFNDE